MPTSKKIGLVIIAITLIFFGLVHQFAIATQRTVLTPDYYRGLVKDTTFIESIHKDLQDAFPKMMLEGLLEEKEDELSDEELQLAKKRLFLFSNSLMRAFDSSWLSEQLLKGIDDAAAVIEGDQDQFLAVIDIRDRKELMKQYLIEEMKKLPEETLAELNIRPHRLETEASAFLEETDLPDLIRVSDLISQEKGLNEFSAMVTTSQDIQLAVYVAPLFVFALFLWLLKSLAGVSLSMKWFGSSLFISSVLFALALQFMGRVVFVRIIEEAGFFISAVDTLTPVALYTTSRAMTAPLIYGAVGILFFLGGYYSKK